MVDLGPATDELARLVAGIHDQQLTAATPCAGTTLGDLLDHVDNLAQAFAAAAVKRPVEGRAVPDASRLGDDWRTRIPQRLAALAAAWRDPAAWAGMTRAGGIDMPGEVAGIVALDETLVHGWDIAAASGQPFRADPDLIEAAMGFVRSVVANHPDGSPGLFGPPVPVPEDAPLVDRLIGLTGRDPRWAAGVPR